MARPGKVTPEKATRLGQLLAEGRSLSSIATELGVTERTVRRHVRRPVRPPSGPRPVESAPADDEPMGDDEQRSLFSGLLREAAERSRTLRTTDPAAANQAARLADAYGRALARIKGAEPPPDPNAHPDMVAAAAMGRAKLAEYTERIRLGKCQGRAGARPSGGATSSSS